LNSLIDSSYFEGNSVTTFAGAVCVYSELAGANNQTTVNRCTFYANGAKDGGVLTNQVTRGATGRLTVARSRFLENYATGRGGAILQTTSSANVAGTTGQLSVSNSLFANNVAPNNSGGAIAQTLLINTVGSTSVNNCTFFGNMCNGNGAAIFNSAVTTGGTVTVTNSIFRQNTTFNAGGKAFWNADPSAVTNVSYSLLDLPSCAAHASGTGSLNCGAGVIFGDALFVDETNGDFHLSAGSPALDAGTSVGAPMVDIDGTARPQGAGVDMGAFEFTGVLPRLAFQSGIEAGNPLDFKVFPNPSDGAFTLSFDREVSGYAQVFDLQGRLIASEQLNGANLAQFDLGAMSAGTFLLRVVSGDAVVTKQIVVARN
jgi:hypothetical protein